MTRLQAVGVMLVALGLIYAVLYAAWVRKRRRYATAAIAAERHRAEGASPEAPSLHDERVAQVIVEGTYVSTTAGDNRFERVTTEGLGNRAKATLHGAPRQLRPAGPHRAPGRVDRDHPGLPAGLGAPRPGDGGQVRRRQPDAGDPVEGPRGRPLRDRLPAALPRPTSTRSSRRCGGTAASPTSRTRLRQKDIPPHERSRTVRHRSTSTSTATPAVLVLEDGRTFRGEAYGAVGADRRGGGLLHRDDRLPGDAHRPELPPPGGRDDRAARRQHRDQRRGRRVPQDLGRRLRRARPRPAAVQLAQPARPRGRAARPRASSGSAASTPAR